MKRQVVALVAVAVAALLSVAVVGAVSTAPASNAAPAAKKRCKAGSKPATIAGKRVCVKVGQRCKTKLDRRYHRYKLHCVSGRLARAHPKPKPEASADLEVGLQAPTQGQTGTKLTWVVTVANRGPAVARGVRVTLSVPLTSGVAFDSAQTGPHQAPTTQAGCSGVGGSEVTCSFNAVAANAPFTITVTGVGTVAGSIVATASVRAATRDPVASNGSATAPTAIVPPPPPPP